MTHREIVDYCLKKPGAYPDFPFNPVMPVIKVKSPSQKSGRIFAQPFFLRDEPKLTLNCTPVSAEYYRGMYPGSVVRGYHCPPIQQPHFNTINLDGTVPDNELIRMIDHAYEVVVAKLPRYIQKELGLAFG
jgi:predicted DNA-binding protein (MmcQ/YjbR family)